MLQLAIRAACSPMRALAVSVVAAALTAGPADAAVVFANLGTGAPPATVGTYAVTPYNLTPQAAIPNGTNVSVIPGSPVAPDTTTSPQVQKRSVGDGWKTWSHGYRGPVFFSVSSVTLTTAAAKAFYVYVEPNALGGVSVTVTTNSGGTSGPILVQGSDGATGFGFYTTAGESIASVAITANNVEGFAFAELGLGSSAPGTPSPTPTRTPKGSAGGCSVPAADTADAAGSAGAGLILFGVIAVVGILRAWRRAASARWPC